MAEPRAETTDQSYVILGQARDLLRVALDLFDVAEPRSMLAVKCQQLIDDVEAILGEFERSQLPRDSFA